MSKKAKVITFINYKGGVGKTLLSINIASYLSNKHKVLFIDADKQGNATALLFNKYFDENNILTLFEEKGFNFVKLYDKTGYDKADMKELYFLPGSLELSDNEDKIKKKNNASEILKNALKESLNDFDYVIIDSPPDSPTGSIIVKNVLAVSDYYIIPYKPAPQEYLGFSNLMKKIKELRAENIKPDFLGIIVNMFISEEAYTTATYLKEILDTNIFPREKLFENVISRSQAYENALSRGLPVDLDAKAAKKYKEAFYDLTTEILERINS